MPFFFFFFTVPSSSLLSYSTQKIIRSKYACININPHALWLKNREVMEKNII